MNVDVRLVVTGMLFLAASGVLFLDSTNVIALL